MRATVQPRPPIVTVDSIWSPHRFGFGDCAALLLGLSLMMVSALSSRMGPRGQMRQRTGRSG
jgi:hypothetical protein